MAGRGLSIALAGILALEYANPGLEEAAAACANEDARPSEISSAQAAAAVVCAMNEERTSRGMRALKPNRGLTNAARAHTRYMVDRDCFLHKCPGEDDLVGRVFDTSYLPCRSCSWGLGENLAWGSQSAGTPRAIVDSWMKSKGHRHNLLNRKYRDVGMGVRPGSPTAAQRPDSMTYTADYGFKK